MTEFSVFPTAHWAVHKPEQLAILWHKDKDSELFCHLSSEINWQQFQILLEQSAYCLTQKGVTKGQTVAYVGSHRLATVVCYTACLMLGVNLLMLNPNMPLSQRSQILDNVVVDHLLDEQLFSGISANTERYTFQQSADFERVYTLTLTSGSTNLPKAVAHHLQAHLANAKGVCERMDFSAEDRWLLTLPLFHVSGQGIIWRWLLQGATLVIAEQKNEIYAHLSTVSHASLVPTQLQRYLQFLDGKQPPEQHILLGGATIPQELVNNAIANGITTYSGYGMTEMASTITMAKNQPNNVGKPLLGREVKLVNDEIWVKGAGLAFGYRQAGQMIPLTNTQGWLQTNDRGELTEKGELKVIGRLDNMFISGGENVQPEQIENCLSACPIVKQIVIVPKSDPEFGQRAIALVEFQEFFSRKAVSELQQFAEQHLENFKQPIAYIPFQAEKWQVNGMKISRKALIEYIDKL